ncbi:MAG TPA: PEP-CTERM sorting domain-containing protein [Candidatus Acidoferrales bacterium]|nr:PEP-CTERM sorting domain-containing protein [Candidatus Acidoferrales bacterium]
MRMKTGLLALSLAMFAVTPAFAGTTNFSFAFGGSDMTLGTSQSYTSNGATITAYGYECSATTPSSTDTLSGCSASALYQKNDGGAEVGLGLAGETDHEIGWDGANADFVIGLDVSSLFKLGATSMTLSFGSVQPGEAYAILGYGSNPFGSTFALTNTQAWVANDGSTSAQVFSSTIGLNAGDEFLVIVSPCGASATGSDVGCGGNVTLGSLTSSAPTPEPGTLALFATGLLALGFCMRRRLAFQRQ